MIGIIFIIILDTVLINYDQDGNCRNKSGLSTFLPVWTADEWGTYHHHPHRPHPHHAGEQARQRGRQAGHDGGSAENSKNCKNCETCVRNIREVIMMTVFVIMIMSIYRIWCEIEYDGDTDIYIGYKYIDLVKPLWGHQDLFALNDAAPDIIIIMFLPIERFVRLGTASMLSQADGPFINLARWILII